MVVLGGLELDFLGWLEVSGRCFFYPNNSSSVTFYVPLVVRGRGFFTRPRSYTELVTSSSSTYKLGIFLLF